MGPTKSNYSWKNHSPPVSSTSRSNNQPPFETNPVALARRQKQIDYGKATIEYYTYLQKVPVESRLPSHPRTPDRNQKCSRRSFDGQIKMWRLLLHAYNPETEAKSREE